MQTVVVSRWSSLFLCARCLWPHSVETLQPETQAPYFYFRKNETSRILRNFGTKFALVQGSKNQWIVESLSQWGCTNCEVLCIENKLQATS